MNEGKKLTIQMALFFLIVFVAFGTIIVKEKSTILFLPKIETSLNKYLNENYNSLEFEKGKINVKDNIYTMKIFNKNNKNHYFYVTYSNKEINDTYKADYLEGKTLLNHINKVIENKIYTKTNKKYTVKINNTLDNFSDKIKDILFKEKNIESLKIYTIETEITVNFNSEEITKSIADIMTNLNNENITPKNYIITITDQNDITKSVMINNLTYDNIKNNNLSIIIDDIINNKETSILTENKITYEYLN